MGRTIVDDAAVVNCANTIGRALKPLKKEGINSLISVATAQSIEKIVNFAHCPKSAADPAGAASAALSRDAVLSHRPSGLCPDGLALSEGRAGVTAMGRPLGDGGTFAAFGGGVRRREILYSSRRRLGR